MLKVGDTNLKNLELSFLTLFFHMKESSK